MITATRYLLPTISPPKDLIEELNQWLVDPVLRNTAMSKIMQSDDLTVEFDENGIPIQVIKIQEDGNI